MHGFCPLASGSKGNCLYLGSNGTKILIDAGISARSIKNKLAQIDVDIHDIDAILISHEHSDHIRGLAGLADLGIPFLSNHETAKAISLQFVECPKFKIFTTGESFEFQHLTVHPFSIQHDAMDPVAFAIETAKHKVGVCTDLGFVTSLIEHQLRQCDYLYVEANHQPSMVHACARSPVYKQRVLSKHGHLSNEACGKLIKEIYHDKLKHVHLAHLSSECNSFDTAISIVQEILRSHNQDVELSIAPQDALGKFISFSN